MKYVRTEKEVEGPGRELFPANYKTLYFIPSDGRTFFFRTVTFFIRSQK
jgi:hypothetical protein